MTCFGCVMVLDGGRTRAEVDGRGRGERRGWSWSARRTLDRGGLRETSAGSFERNDAGDELMDHLMQVRYLGQHALEPWRDERGSVWVRGASELRSYPGIWGE